MEENGKVTPLSEKPKITYINSWYINMFSVLSNSRSGGMNSEDPIQFSEIMSYVDHFVIIDTIDVFVDITQAMDRIYLLYKSKLVNKQEKKSAKRA